MHKSRIAEPRAIHDLKVSDLSVFDALYCNSKNFEWRKEDDRRFELGEVVRIFLYQEGGRQAFCPPLTKLITSILRGPQYGVPAGYVILGLEPFEMPDEDGFEHLFAARVANEN